MSTELLQHAVSASRYGPTRIVRALALAALSLGLVTTSIANSAPNSGTSAATEVSRTTSSVGVADNATLQPADLAADSTYLLPGVLNRTTSLRSLRQRFGAEHVTVMDIDGAEGATTRGIVLFANDPARRAEIFPRDEATPNGIALLRVSGTQSRWHLDTGVHLGMSLDALVAANGKPITFSGLGWDYGGGVRDWHAGRLASGKGDSAHRGVVLTLAVDADADAVPMGDSEFRSDDKSRFPKQGTLLLVGELLLGFASSDGE